MPEAPLHILITDPHTRGGGQITYIQRLAAELTRLGHRVTIGCRQGSLLAEIAAEEGYGLLDCLHFARGLRLLPWASDVRRLRKFFRTAAPDVLHVNGSQDHWACAIANRGAGICLLRTRHNTYPVKDTWTNRRLNREWTDYQIVVCGAVRRELAQQPAFRRERMCTIHNGVDAERFRPDTAARSEKRAEFGFGENDLVCGLVGRLVEAKGHRFLLKAMSKLKNDSPQLKALFVGEGELDETLRAMARELGLTDSVRFCGYRNDMHRCVQAVDIGVQPSIDCDTSSFSLKEIMAAEKPVIASDYGGLTEIVRDGVEGLVVPAGEHTSLGSALHRLIEDPVMREKFGKAGRRRVLNEFTVQVFAQRTLDTYYRALALHAAGGPGA